MDNEENKIELFRRMFCEHYPRLVRLAVQLTGDDEEGRDVVSDVMETAWRNFGGIDTARQGTWLRTCVYNACLNRLKHRGVESRHAALMAESCRMATEADMVERERLVAGGGGRAAWGGGGGCCRTVGRAYTDSHTVVLLRAQHVQPDRRTPRNKP